MCLDHNAFRAIGELFSSENNPPASAAQGNVKKIATKHLETLDYRMLRTFEPTRSLHKQGMILSTPRSSKTEVTFDLLVWFSKIFVYSQNQCLKHGVSVANTLVLVGVYAHVRLGCRVRLECGDRSLHRVRRTRWARVRRHPDLWVGQVPQVRRHLRHQPRLKVTETIEMVEASLSTTQPAGQKGG